MLKNACYSISILALLGAIPAAAQDASGQSAADQPASVQPGDERINQLIIYDDEVCPPSTDEEIVVCIRLDEPFRIPKNLRSDPNARGKEAWTERVRAYEYVAASGIGSCSTSGFGGFIGCGIRDINAAALEKEENPGLVFGRLIAEARQKRLAGIDAEAEEIEDIVLAEERAAALKKLQEQANDVSVDTQSGDADAAALPQPK